jgi:hypothetical protein
VRFGSNRQSERAVFATKQAISGFKRYAVEGGLLAIVESGDARDAVNGDRYADLQTKVFDGGQFCPKLVVDCGVGAVSFAEPAEGLELDLLFAQFADIGAHGEPENELRIDRGRALDGRRQRQHSEEGSRPYPCGHEDACCIL